MITLADGQLILSSFNSQDWTDVDKIRYLIKSATVNVAGLNRLVISPGASQWNGSLITQMGKNTYPPVCFVSSASQILKQALIYIVYLIIIS